MTLGFRFLSFGDVLFSFWKMHIMENRLPSSKTDLCFCFIHVVLRNPVYFGRFFFYYCRALTCIFWILLHNTIKTKQSLTYLEPINYHQGCSAQSVFITVPWTSVAKNKSLFFLNNLTNTASVFTVTFLYLFVFIFIYIWRSLATHSVESKMFTSHWQLFVSVFISTEVSERMQMKYTNTSHKIRI